MSQPSSFPPYSPGHDREHAEAETRFSNALAFTFRDLGELAAAVMELDSKRLAEICKLSTADSARAGELLRQYTIQAAHERARFTGDCEEQIEPLTGWKPSRPPVSLLPLVEDMMLPYRTGGVLASSVTAKAEPESLSVSASVDGPQDPALLREKGAL